MATLRFRALIFCALWGCTTVAAQAHPFSLETHPEYGQTLWHDVLGPNNAEVLGTMNNRPFAFDRSTEFQKEQADAEPILKRALLLAEAHRREHPSDYVESLLNLGCFYLISYEWKKADDYMTKAISACRELGFEKKPSMPSYLDHAAIAARTVEDWGRAHRLYQEAMELRVQQYGPRQIDVAHSHINHANLSSTRAVENDGDARMHAQYRKYHEAEAKAIMQEHPESSKSEEVGRPSISSMTVNKGRRQLPIMVSFARSIIEKHHHPRPQLEAPAGIATIIGNWSAPTDITTEATITTETEAEQTLEGIEKRSGHHEQSSKTAGVDIFLCPVSEYGLIWNGIVAFGAGRGLDIKDFGSTWPANHKQAQALMLSLKNIAAQIRFRQVRTDKNGDYEIEKIPRGTYFLYAGLVTQDQCQLWLNPSPTEPIVVSKVQQFQCDFGTGNGKTVWSRFGGASPAISRTNDSSSTKQARMVSSL
jgi:hypothetical protein